MFEVLGLDISGKIIFFLMLSFSFFVGILLMVSREGFDAFNKALQKEYGLRKRIAPQIEDTHVDVVDKILTRYRFMAGMLICLASFFLLLIYKL